MVCIYIAIFYIIKGTQRALCFITSTLLHTHLWGLGLSVLFQVTSACSLGGGIKLPTPQLAIFWATKIEICSAYTLIFLVQNIKSEFGYLFMSRSRTCGRCIRSAAGISSQLEIASANSTKISLDRCILHSSVTCSGAAGGCSPTYSCWTTTNTYTQSSQHYFWLRREKNYFYLKRRDVSPLHTGCTLVTVGVLPVSEEMTCNSPGHLGFSFRFGNRFWQRVAFYSTWPQIIAQFLFFFFSLSFWETLGCVGLWDNVSVILCTMYECWTWDLMPKEKQSSIVVCKKCDKDVVTLGIGMKFVEWKGYVGL